VVVVVVVVVRRMTWMVMISVLVRDAKEDVGVARAGRAPATKVLSAQFALDAGDQQRLLGEPVFELFDHECAIFFELEREGVAPLGGASDVDAVVRVSAGVEDAGHAKLLRVDDAELRAKRRLAGAQLEDSTHQFGVAETH
jgi:hypothetical protein